MTRLSGAILALCLCAAIPAGGCGAVAATVGGAIPAAPVPAAVQVQLVQKLDVAEAGFAALQQGFLSANAHGLLVGHDALKASLKRAFDEGSAALDAAGDVASGAKAGNLGDQVGAALAAIGKIKGLFGQAAIPLPAGL